MKKIFINFVILTAVAFSSAATQEIDRMIAEIKEPRKGIELKELSSIPNPFVTVKKDVNITEVFVPKKREENMELGGIVNRKAYINGGLEMETKKVCVLGAGIMGAGIAQVAAQSGFEVVLRDVEDSLVDKGMMTIRKNLDRSVSKGKMERLYITRW